MASGSTAMLRRSRQASAEHFQQCAEFPPLRNRGLGPLAVTVLPIRLPGGRRYRLRRRVIDSGLFSSLVTGRVSVFCGSAPFIHKLTVKVS